ncbi:MAG: trimethylamine methyltransferase [Rhodospirillales bacterium]|nr:trimethylamine methyltransferase [Rhodospirillales bacterium]
MMQNAQYLSDDQVKRIHEASLEILRDTGLLVRNEKARIRFAEHGCEVNHETEVVTFPADLVEKCVEMTPPTFTICGRDPAHDFTLPCAEPRVATASSAPDMVDPVSGETRRATSHDIARLGHLVNEMDGIDVFSISVLADDAPEGQFNLSRFYPALKNCSKPVRTSVLDVEECEQILKLGETIAGSREDYFKHQFITFGYCAVVSPLTMDYDSTDMLMYFAENDITAYGTIAPVGGAGTPLTLVGTLALINAEWLATCVLTQISKAGRPMLYNFLPVFTDMRDGSYATGAIEIGIMNSAICQMARFYDVPSAGYLGLTNSKTSDAQAGYEKGMSPILGTMSGVNYIVMGGLLDALMSLDLAQVAIDNEIALMAKRAACGMEFSEENLALDEIKKAGHGGMYIGNPETLKRMTKTCFLPELADRTIREVWEMQGSRDVHARALDQVRFILTQPNKYAISAETDAKIKAAFPGIVAGDSVPPEGWIAPEQTRGRRQSRRHAKAS